jgi:phosphatidylglycerol:prolipoprotein diacylglycerol transferase
MIEINVSPVAFYLGSLEVRWYGIMLALAVVVLILWAFLQIRRGAKLTYDQVLTAAIIAIPSAIIFSRLLHVVDLWEFYSQNPGEIIGFSGLTIYGAILGAAIGVWVYSRFNDLNFAYMADIITPGILLAQAIGRVGCLLNGCCYGTESEVFCSIVYSNPESFGPIGNAVHPTQVYEIIFLLLTFVSIYRLQHRLLPLGSLFAVYLSFYAVWRFAIGFVRENTIFALGLEQSQLISVIVLVITVPWIIKNTRFKKSNEGNHKKIMGS